MIRAEIIAVGRLKKGPLQELWQDYIKRLQWPVTLHEIEAKSKADEEKRLLDKIDPGATVFALDEHGKSLSSRDFSKKLEKLSMEGTPDIQFIIGGADGLPQSIHKKAHSLLSFGIQTWPHMLARVMLAEQLYRAQQIIAGHPYHRD